MQKVCYKETDSRFPRYGGRGITCEWEDFEEFCNDMFDSFKAHLKEHGRLNTTIERINNDGNYSKGNCRWATRKEQARNRANGTKITFENQTLSITEWGEKLGIPSYVLELRIKRRKWPIEAALTTPILPNGQTFKPNSGLFKKGHVPLNNGRNQFSK